MSDQTKDFTVRFRVSPVENELLDLKADKKRMTKSELIRSKVFEVDMDPTLEPMIEDFATKAYQIPIQEAKDAIVRNFFARDAAHYSVYGRYDDDYHIPYYGPEQELSGREKFDATVAYHRARFEQDKRNFENQKAINLANEKRIGELLQRITELEARKGKGAK